MCDTRKLCAHALQTSTGGTTGEINLCYEVTVSCCDLSCYMLTGGAAHVGLVNATWLTLALTAVY